MLRRIFVVVLVGSALAAAGIGVAAQQTFSPPGVAAEGAATAGSCSDLRVEYTQTAGTVTQITVVDGGAPDCEGKRVHIFVQRQNFTFMFLGSASISGGSAVFAVSLDTVEIRQAIVTVTDS